MSHHRISIPQHPPLQPRPHRLIIPLQTSISQHNRGQQYEQTNRQSFLKRDFAVAHPSSVNVQNGKVRDVDRVGNIAQKIAQARREFSFDLAAGTQKNDKREDENDGQRIVEAVHPQVFAAADSGNGKHRYNQQTTPKEGVFDVD